jgi:hypothetical protein
MDLRFQTILFDEIAFLIIFLRNVMTFSSYFMYNFHKKCLKMMIYDFIA